MGTCTKTCTSHLHKQDRVHWAWPHLLIITAQQITPNLAACSLQQFLWIRVSGAVRQGASNLTLACEVADTMLTRAAVIRMLDQIWNTCSRHVPVDTAAAVASGFPTWAAGAFSWQAADSHQKKWSKREHCWSRAVFHGSASEAHSVLLIVQRRPVQCGRELPTAWLAGRRGRWKLCWNPATTPHEYHLT